MKHRPLLALPLVLACTLAACASDPAEEQIGSTRGAVIKGKPSTSAQDAVVLLIHYDPSNRSFGECTGTLIAPNLVLTARHCVADTDPYAACDAEGKPLAAGVVRRNHKASTMYVFTGKDRPDFSRGRVEPAGTGARIVDDGGKNLCNHDIALVVLEEPVADAKIAPIRLEAEVEQGEVLTAVGWGVTERTPQPAVRQQRTGIKVTGVGPDKDSFPPIPPNEFQVGESICSGDSGGPAFAESGAVVGVVSRGGNAQQQDPNNPAASCIGATNLYMKLAPFQEMILGAFELAEAEPWLEGQPDPRLLKPGSACADGSECRSSLCLSDPDQANELTCAQDCSAADCPEGQVCAVEGDVSVCRLPKKPSAAAPEPGGLCSGAPAGPSSSGFAIAVAAFGVAALRRRRRAA